MTFLGTEPNGAVLRPAPERNSEICRTFSATVSARRRSWFENHFG